jgi:hypothetical protein
MLISIFLNLKINLKIKRKKNMLRRNLKIGIRLLSNQKPTRTLYDKLNHEDIAALKYVTHTVVDEEKQILDAQKENKKKNMDSKNKKK